MENDSGNLRWNNCTETNINFQFNQSGACIAMHVYQISPTNATLEDNPFGPVSGQGDHFEANNLDNYVKNDWKIPFLTKSTIKKGSIFYDIVTNLPKFF